MCATVEGQCLEYLVCITLNEGSIEFTNPNVKFSLRLSKSSYHLLAVQPCVKIQFVLLDFEMLEKVAAIEVSM